MEVSGNQFKQFLHSKEFSLLVEKIVTIYSTAIIKKIQDVEDQLKKFVKLNETLIESSTSKNQNENVGIIGLSEYSSDSGGRFSTNTLGSFNEDITKVNNKNSFFLNTNDKDLNSEDTFSITNEDNSDTLSGYVSGRSSDISTSYSSVKGFPIDSNKTENVLFDKKIYIKNITLPKKDYNRSMVLGICSTHTNTDKVIFENRGRRFWVHLDNCKPRSRSEKIVKSRLEEALPGKKYLFYYKII